MRTIGEEAAAGTGEWDLDRAVRVELVGPAVPVSTLNLTAVEGCAHAKHADRGLRRSFEAVEAGITGLARQWTDYRARRATYLALTKLDDRFVRDIGLTRADVELRPGELPAAFEEPAPAPFVRAAVVSHDFKRAA